jgi:hypothetical protein|tara:strand:+ start:1641 stop:1775 length:135 start_codon:yes stop_codon:yes gene_type:complete
MKERITRNRKKLVVAVGAIIAVVIGLDAATEADLIALVTSLLEG